MSKSRPRCVRCKSKSVLPIAYGYPSPQMMKAAEEGKILLGGCCITDHDPQWGCAECGHRWREDEVVGLKC